MNSRIDLGKLQNYVEEGYLRSQSHPVYKNLHIFNYTEKVQFKNDWDDLTLMCRGLVVDMETGEIVARPFKKFFNIEEKKHTPTKEFEVFEKMDGSLGILFNYASRWIFATRGSFTSEQALKGKEIFDKNHNYYDLNPKCTYLFEIIYPENKIVVNYGEEEKLVLLGKIHTTENKEFSIFKYGLKNFNVVNKYYNVNDYTKLKEAILPNNEGFVVKFSNGDRCKIKGEDYIRLHKIMTNFSTRNIWDALRNGEDIYELLKDVPDEFYDKIDLYIRELHRKFRTLKSHYYYVFYFMTQTIGLTDRKKFAQKAKNYKHPGLLFSILDDKNIDQAIWKIIEPEYKLL